MSCCHPPAEYTALPSVPPDLACVVLDHEIKAAIEMWWQDRGTAEPETKIAYTRMAKKTKELGPNSKDMVVLAAGAFAAQIIFVKTLDTGRLWTMLGVEGRDLVFQIWWHVSEDAFVMPRLRDWLMMIVRRVRGARCAEGRS